MKRLFSSKTTVTMAIPSMQPLLQSFLGELTPVVHASTNSSWERLLFQLLTPDEELTPPYAAIGALGNRWNDSQNSSWVRFDPVELQIDAGNIYLLGNQHLSLETSESLELIAEINDFLYQDGLKIQQGRGHDWYMKITDELDLTTFSIGEIVGKDIRAYMPTGRDAPVWRKRLTEIQMLLFQNRINALRMKSHKPLINSVWLWGGGRIHRSYNPIQYNAVWHNHSFISGMLGIMKVHYQQFHCDEFALATINSPGNYLYIAPDNFNMDQLIQIIKLIYEAVKVGEIHQFNVHVNGRDNYRWQKSWRNRFRFISF